ncbi:protein of unknown function, DUF2276-containing [Geobacter metallireducens GS-15]|uniref:CRISPR-associated protein Cas6 C-terminal domain-containing protein n=2 Tax=Geobacter metallireducens TaxID=28232 RepID=Q39T05_GEOMG|nr:CRISPR system precrRNA processing endoribonuclease RAMP protein Cas6 [Geobacter metallireducens]ABB32619.1 protein of unknown function, DUF2276-containing [Geobacter metallireducens GS-15]
MTIAVLRITIRLAEDISDPYLLFRIRDGFQRSFRRVVGCAEEECVLCNRRNECPYRIVFAQALSSDPATVKRHQKPPLPFAFSFPVIPSQQKSDTLFEIRLALLGTATRFVTEFLDSLKLLCSKHDQRDELAAIVERVESLGYRGEPYLIYAADHSAGFAESLTLLTSEGLCDTRWVDVSGDVTLRLLTPLKIMQDGRPSRTFSFPLLMRTLIRRISSLASYYCDDEILVDFRWLASLCETVTVSGSSIQWVEWGGGKQGRKLAGLTGEAVLSSVPEEFIPFLLLGEFLNVGKGAAFGLGRFSIGANCP